MKNSDFVRDSEVVKQIDRLEKGFVRKKKEVSDIVDSQGRQYVDLVMEGGGVLGIALVGYTYALEKAGIRFLGVGGTSAGAINALLTAGVGPPQEAKSTKVIRILSELEMFKFVDGDSDARDFVRALIDQAGPVKLLWKGGQVLDNMINDLGLNPGDEFLRWLAEQLRNHGVSTVADLEKQMTPPKLKLRGGKALHAKKAGARLALIAADITTETKVVFPRMAPLYWLRYREKSPATFARASMSIPGFFHPFRVKPIPRGLAAAKLWDKHAGYTGRLPDEVMFVDGGIMSNFPIGMFHSTDSPPHAPTFGAKLGVERSEPREIKTLPSFAGAIFDAARHCADYEFLMQNPDYKHLVGYIPTGPHNWLDFFITDKSKIDLFRRGVKTGVDFLLKFDWAAYKEARKSMPDSK